MSGAAVPWQYSNEDETHDATLLHQIDHYLSLCDTMDSPFSTSSYSPETCASLFHSLITRLKLDIFTDIQLGPEGLYSLRTFFVRHLNRKNDLPL